MGKTWVMLPPSFMHCINHIRTIVCDNCKHLLSYVNSSERKAHVYQYWIREIGLVTAAYNKAVLSVIVNQTTKDRKSLTALD